MKYYTGGKRPDGRVQLRCDNRAAIILSQGLMGNYHPDHRRFHQHFHNVAALQLLLVLFAIYDHLICGLCSRVSVTVCNNSPIWSVLPCFPIQSPHDGHHWQKKAELEGVLKKMYRSVPGPRQ